MTHRAPDEVSIPSSVRKAGADARIAEREAGDWMHNDVLRDLVEKWRAREAWHRNQCVTKAEGCGKAETFRECMNELESVIGSNEEES